MRIDLTNSVQPNRPTPGTISLKDTPRPAQAVRREDAPRRTVPPRPRNRAGRTVVLSIVAALVLLGAVSSYVALSRSGVIANASSNEMKSLVASVGALMLLPQGETPTTATVSDLNALSSEPFFAHAQIGDKVLIYPKAQKAILYRPSTNKIIEVAPVVGAQ